MNGGITVEAAADVLGVSRIDVYRLINRGAISRTGSDGSLALLDADDVDRVRRERELDVITAPEIAEIFRIESWTAKRMILSGVFGEVFRVPVRGGRRVAVLRSAVETAISRI